MRIRGDRIVALGTSLSPQAGEDQLDLDGELLIPGLVNGHDHLHLDVCPRSGRGPYRDAHAWAREVDEGRGFGLAPFVALDRETRCRWGALRNLFSGVTWVGHHDARYPVCDADDFGVRLPRRYAQLNSVRHGDPAEARRSAGRDAALFVHLAEGVGDEARSELDELERRGGLGPETVAVHGVAFTPRDRARLDAAGAALVACPSSNRFLLGEAASIAGLRRWALGTDSTLTGSAHLLDELRVANECLETSIADLAAAVTHRAAAILRLPLGAGRIEVGAPACLAALRTDASDIARALLQARPASIALVVNRTIRMRHPDLASAAGEDLDGTVRIDGERRYVSREDADLVRRVRSVLPNAAPAWLDKED